MHHNSFLVFLLIGTLGLCGAVSVEPFGEGAENAIARRTRRQATDGTGAVGIVSVLGNGLACGCICCSVGSSACCASASQKFLNVAGLRAIACCCELNDIVDDTCTLSKCQNSYFCPLACPSPSPSSS